MAYCTGNIIGPQLFLAREAPSYTSGFLAIMVCFGVGVASCLALRLFLIRENRIKDQVNGVLGASGFDDDLMVNLMDKTDKEIPQFRYVY